MDLRKEHCQDHSKHCDQVHLPPILKGNQILIVNCQEKEKIMASTLHIPNYWLGICICEHDYLPSFKKMHVSFLGLNN